MVACHPQWRRRGRIDLKCKCEDQDRPSRAQLVNTRCKLHSVSKRGQVASQIWHDVTANAFSNNRAFWSEEIITFSPITRVRKWPLGVCMRHFVPTAERSPPWRTATACSATYRRRRTGLLIVERRILNLPLVHEALMTCELEDTIIGDQGTSTTWYTQSPWDNHTMQVDKDIKDVLASKYNHRLPFCGCHSMHNRKRPR